MNQPRKDPGGPVIAVCTGQRCRALRTLCGSDASLDTLKSAVRHSRAGVLISTGCLGRCSLAAVVVLAWQGEPGGRAIPLAGMDNPERAHALTTWIPGSGPAHVLLHGAGLPEPLADANAEANAD